MEHDEQNPLLKTDKIDENRSFGISEDIPFIFDFSMEHDGFIMNGDPVRTLLNPLDGIEIKMKVMLFSGDQYYPSGGWEDFKGFFDTVDEAKAFLELDNDNPSFEWAHIVEDGKITWEGSDTRRMICPGNPEGYWVWEEVKDE